MDYITPTERLSAEETMGTVKQMITSIPFLSQFIVRK